MTRYKITMLIDVDLGDDNPPDEWDWEALLDMPSDSIFDVSVENIDHPMTTVNLKAGKYTITGVYTGGPYIDLYFKDFNPKDYQPFTVINVWDYVRGDPAIDNDEDSVLTAMKDWVAEMGDNFDHDMNTYYHEQVGLF